MPQLVVYPSCDGYLARVSAPTEVWTNIRNAGSATSVDSIGNKGYILISVDDHNSPYYEELYRGIIIFDTSALPDDAIIISASLGLYGENKYENGAHAIGININICAVTTVSPSSLALSDYGRFSSTLYCDTPITYASWITTGYNYFTLNGIGRAAISKAGITKFGIRNANYDITGSEPAWHDNTHSWMSWYQSEKGAGYKPILTIVYTTEEGLGTGNIVTLEALRNLEMVGQSRLYIDDEGKAKYESRFHRSL